MRRPLLSVSLLAGIVVSLTAGAVRGQNPTAEEVIQKFISATGGKEALEAVKSIEINGKMEFQGDGAAVTFDFTICRDADNYLLSVALPGAGEIVKGRKGDIAWTVEGPGTPARKLEGKEKQQFLQYDAVMHEQLSWLEFDGQITVSEADVDGKPTWELVFESETAGTARRFFDKESGLVVKVLADVESPQLGAAIAESIPSDYKEVSGIKLAHRLSNTVAGEGYVIIYSEVKTNVEFAEDRFTPPEGIGN